jgi:hypothetical protein
LMSIDHYEQFSTCRYATGKTGGVAEFQTAGLGRVSGSGLGQTSGPQVKAQLATIAEFRSPETGPQRDAKTGPLPAAQAPLSST